MEARNQLKLTPDGLWHRRVWGNGGDHTACGLLIGPAVSRDWILDDALCPRCYSEYERETGKMKKIERESLDSLEDTTINADFEDDTPTDPRD